MVGSQRSGVFRVAPQVLGPLGAEQLQDPALAVLELVKNAWDADATKVEIFIGESALGPTVTVTDNGHGMDANAFSDRWLVIGSSRKRRDRKSPALRPLIGEKGLGRLATFALGRRLTVESSTKDRQGFRAQVDWSELMGAASLDEYAVPMELLTRDGAGTTIVVEALNDAWEKKHSNFLLDHLSFLTAVPGETFDVVLTDPWESRQVESPAAMLENVWEAEIEAEVVEGGAAKVVSCSVSGIDKSQVVFRPIREADRAPDLAGVRIHMYFFRRDEAVRRLGNLLARNLASGFLETYQGVRIFQDGINVPPYGLRGNDWAQLEKLRTQTGGPTLTPGNSQLFGEVHLSKDKHSDFVITAGRSGFANQGAVERLATYLKWAVRALATARRAAQLEIDSGNVPGRVDFAGARKDGERSRVSPKIVRSALNRAAQSKAAEEEPVVQSAIAQSQELVTAFERGQIDLRLYAQLASSGIAATSFAHELRGDFDVVTASVKELGNYDGIDPELMSLLSHSWSSIRSFVSLFQLMPVRVRRKRQTLTIDELKTAARRVLSLPKEKNIRTRIEAQQSFSVRLVPAEFDSVLLNLVSNSLKAIKASENRGDGAIRLRLDQVGKALVLAVADNGCGVSDAVRKIMFDPLEGEFEEGTGMGLPIVQFVASQYNGSVECHSVDDRGYGTEFVATFKNVVEGP
jgi:signal transduction histidine kinase